MIQDFRAIDSGKPDQHPTLVIGVYRTSAFGRTRKADAEDRNEEAEEKSRGKPQNHKTKKESNKKKENRTKAKNHQKHTKKKNKGTRGKTEVKIQIEKSLDMVTLSAQHFQL